MASSSSKRAGMKVYNPKPLSQAPPETNPFESGIPFVSEDIFDRTAIPPGDPKRHSLRLDYGRACKKIGRKYMIFIEPVTGEHFRSLEELRRHLGHETKRSKSKTNSSCKDVPVNAPKQEYRDDSMPHYKECEAEFERDMQQAILESQMTCTYGLDNSRNDGASSSRSLRPDKAPIEEPYDDRDHN